MQFSQEVATYEQNKENTSTNQLVLSLVLPKPPKLRIYYKREKTGTWIKHQWWWSWDFPWFGMWRGLNTLKWGMIYCCEIGKWQMEPGTAAYFSIPLLVLEELGMPLFLSTERNMKQKANLKYKKVQQLEFFILNFWENFIQWLNWSLIHLTRNFVGFSFFIPYKN